MELSGIDRASEFGTKSSEDEQELYHVLLACSWEHACKITLFVVGRRLERITGNVLWTDRPVEDDAQKGIIEGQQCDIQDHLDSRMYCTLGKTGMYNPHHCRDISTASLLVIKPLRRKLTRK